MTVRSTPGTAARPRANRAPPTPPESMVTRTVRQRNYRRQRLLPGERRTRHQLSPDWQNSRPSVQNAGLMFASEHSSGDSRSASAGGASVPTDDSVATSRVVAAILAVGSAELADSLAAVASQDHPVVAIVVIGRVDAVPPDVAVHATVGDLVALIPGDVTHVWLLHSDSRPRRDA